MDSIKPLSFKASAFDYFVLTILSLVLMYIPFFGWALLLNYASGWFADRTLVTGKKIGYKAGYGETLAFVFVNFLLLVITLGIYSFWFYPKLYKYVVDHTDFVAEAAVQDAAPVVPAAPVTESVVTSADTAPVAPETVESADMTATPAASVAPETVELPGQEATDQPNQPTTPQV